MAKTRTSGQGRPKDVPNKITRELKEMIEVALDRLGGADYLVEQAAKSPAAFIALLGKTLPKDMNVNGSLSVNAVVRSALLEIAKAEESAT